MSFLLNPGFLALANIGANVGTGIAVRVQAGKQADKARKRGRLEAEQARREGRQLAGRQRALFSKGGVELVGTPLDVLAQTAEDAELEALRRQLRFSDNADRLETAGTISLTQGILGAGDTLLHGRGDIGSFVRGFRRPKTIASTLTNARFDVLEGSGGSTIG